MEGRWWNNFTWIPLLYHYVIYWGMLCASIKGWQLFNQLWKNCYNQDDAARKAVALWYSQPSLKGEITELCIMTTVQPVQYLVTLSLYWASRQGRVSANPSLVSLCHWQSIVCSPIIQVRSLDTTLVYGFQWGSSQQLVWAGSCGIWILYSMTPLKFSSHCKWFIVYYDSNASV